MRKLTLTAAALVAAVPLAAQEDHFTSSPQGFEGVEGNMSIDLIGKEALLRYQQVDAFTWGAKTNRNRMYWRRDGVLPTNPAYGSRNVEMEVVIAESSLGSMSTTFANNYNTGTDVVVFTKKSVNMPDWAAVPALPPQPESSAFVIFTDVVGWGYPGRSVSATDFLWEVRVWSNDKAGTPYPFDADTVIPTNVPAGGATSAGTAPTCIATGQAGLANAHVDMANFGTHFSMHLDVGSVEVGQNAAMLLGATLQNFPLTTTLGLCGDLELVPLATVSLGAANAAGTAEVDFSNLTYNAALIGQDIHGQGVAFDSVQGLVMARTRTVTVPVDPPAGTQVKYMFALDPTGATATSGILNGGIILHTNHP